MKTKRHPFLDRPILFGTVGIALTFLLSVALNFVFSAVLSLLPIEDSTVQANLSGILSYLCAGSLLLWVLRRRLDAEHYFFLHRGCFAEAIKLLWPLVLVCAINIVPHLMDGDSLVLTGSALASTIVMELLVGFMEEVTFRGAVVSNAMRVWHYNPRKIVYSVLLSGVPFGLAHLINFPNGLAVTLLQVCYAAAFGFLFAAVYLRTGNLFACVLVHGLIDVTDALFPSPNEVTLFDCVLLLGISVLSAAWAAYCVRPSRWKDIDKSFDTIGC